MKQALLEFTLWSRVGNVLIDPTDVSSVVPASDAADLERKLAKIVLKNGTKYLVMESYEEVKTMLNMMGAATIGGSA